MRLPVVLNFSPTTSLPYALPLRSNKHLTEIQIHSPCEDRGTLFCYYRWDFVVKLSVRMAKITLSVKKETSLIN